MKRMSTLLKFWGGGGGEEKQEQEQKKNKKTYQDLLENINVHKEFHALATVRFTP